MHSTRRFQSSIFGASLRPQSATLAILIMLLFFLLGLLLLMFTAQPAQAQTFKVIHNFSGPDGVYPSTGLTMDAAGNLYGTTAMGGVTGYGTVFRLRRAGPGWLLNPLHVFAGGNDGRNPDGRVALAPDGTLYTP